MTPTGDGGERPKHPMLASVILVTTLTVLIVAISLASAYR